MNYLFVRRKLKQGFIEIKPFFKKEDFANNNN